jgi:hypothetical protein
MTRITLDTNLFDETEGLTEAGEGNGFEFARVTVTDREVEGTSYEVTLIGMGEVAENAVWGESRWGEAVWVYRESSLERILQIISNGSFPQCRDNLAAGQRRQLRDAMIFEAHVREARDIFVTRDLKAFIRDGRRERLEATFKTKIMLPEEFKALLKEAAQHADGADR